MENSIMLHHHPDIEKEIAGDLKEVETPGVTSKGSRFRKSVFHYPSFFRMLR